MCPRLSVDELTRDTNAIPGLPHATFEDVTNPKLTADLFHIDDTTLVSKARVTGDHKQPTKARQRHRNILHDPVCEIFLLGICTEVLEGKYGNRRLVGEG